MSDVPVTVASSEQRLLPMAGRNESPSSACSSIRMRGIRSLGKSRSAVYRRMMKRFRRHSKLLWLANDIDDITGPRTYERASQRFLPRCSPVASIAPRPTINSDDKDNIIDDKCDGDSDYNDHNTGTSTPVKPVNDDENSEFMEIENNERDGKQETDDIGICQNSIQCDCQFEASTNEDTTEIRRIVDNSVRLPHSTSDVRPCSNTDLDQNEESCVNNDGNNSHSHENTEEDVNSTGHENGSNAMSYSTNVHQNIFSIDNIGESRQIPRLKNWVTNLYLVASIVALSLRGKLTYATTTLLLKILSNMLLNCKLPRTLQGLWSILSRNDDAAIKHRLYCRRCIDEIGTGIKPMRDCLCKACKRGESSTSLGYFIEVKITPQLRQLFSDPAIVDSLRYRFTRKKKDAYAIEDIYDGAQYKEKCVSGGFLNNRNNFSFSIFMDGCQVSKSSKASAWPILLQINEFPPHARKRHIILAGIWVDTIHAEIETILPPTIQELRQLYREGIEWTNPINGTVVRSKFVTLMCIADSVARPAILNMTLFNGLYGCTFCYAKGQSCLGKGVKRSFPVDDTVSCRTDSEIRQHMEIAHETGEKCFGVKGYTSMALLDEFDLALGTIVESMHNVYLGVVKMHTMLLLMGKSTDLWYAGCPKNIENINSRLMNIRPPSRIARKPRPIENTAQWKASEWRNWIQFWALPCLEGIIRECDLQHLILLSCASWILNKDCIGTDELQEARSLLKRYVRQFEKTFGVVNMRYNIHLLTHLCDTVENWGPLWAHSAFPFESWNKKIIDKVTSANGRPLQIVTRYLMTRFIESFLIDPTIPKETRERIYSIVTDGSKNRGVYIKQLSIHSTFRAIGKYANRQLHDCEYEALRSVGYQPKSVTCYKRALINGTDYRCVKKDEAKKTRFCDEFLYCKRYGYGKILEVISFRHNDDAVCGLLVERIGSKGTAFASRHIENAISTSVKVFVTADEMPLPAMIMDTPSECRITSLPNVWETD